MYNIMAGKYRIQKEVIKRLRASCSREIHTKTSKKKRKKKKKTISEQSLAWIPRIVTPYSVFHARHAISLNMNSRRRVVLLHKKR